MYGRGANWSATQVTTLDVIAEVLPKAKNNHVQDLLQQQSTMMMNMLSGLRRRSSQKKDESDVSNLVVQMVGEVGT